MTTVSAVKEKKVSKNKILMAALGEFSANGFKGANVRAIANQAGVNHGLIRYYFGSKENLWKRAVEFMFEQSRKMTLAGVEDKNSFASVKAFISGYTRYCAKFPEHNRIMMQASMHDRGRLQWVVDNLLMNERDALLANVEAQKKSGIWPDVPTVSIIYIVVSACQMVFAAAPEVEKLYGEDVSDDAFVDAHIDAILQLFFHHQVAS